MDILAGIFHHGLIVDDIAVAMESIGRAAGASWAPVRTFDPLPVWTANGERGEARLKVTYARQGPLRLELVEAAPGTPYDLLRAIDRSHIGVWVDNVGEGVEQLHAQGWRLLVAGASARRGNGSMAYMVRDGGPVIELVGRELEPMMEAWWSAEV
ncbi:VOC family protein [Novosphingobium cyanobacteriorum]|uniref:VOC family protein n=1 Tax=Novosphingobium cyanobacteriorum TaxID=3024215 RepID=A0ABT6CL32_9SPHN|nr:VOC family protein [Novosphingobium cyanobacteriorum]MDF8334629.1 VOC family protein [Novosphingobium cyanobacteriorum]